MIAAINELGQWPQWVAWDYEGEINPNTGKRKKMPRNPNTGGRAMANTPSTWASHPAAIDRSQRDGLAGVGFMFTASDPYCGVDIDNCIDEAGQIHTLAGRIIDQLHSYTEISPSGRGVKIFCKGGIPKSLKIVDVGAGIGLEMYDDRRYFTVTSQHLENTPETINDAQAALDDLFAQYVKQDAPIIPQASTAPRAGGPVDMAYPPAWVAKIVEHKKASAEKMMSAASAGNKHNTRLSAGELLGGYIAGLDAIGYGYLLSPDEAARLIYDANPPAANGRAEYETITDAIAHGMQSPIAIDRPPADRLTSAPKATRATHSDETTPGYTVDPVCLELCPDMPSDAIIKQCLFEDESGDARLFKALYGDRLAYDHSAGAWYLWAGHSWREDGIGMIRPLIEAHIGRCYLGLAIRLNHEAASEQDQLKKDELLKIVGQLQKRAAVLHKLNRQNTIEYQARFHFGITGDCWDSEPYLLAVGNGVIDLRSGDLIAGQPGQYLRKVAPVEYHGLAAAAPRWEQFLAELFEPGGPNEAIPAYLARLFGYGALGLVREAVLPVLYGPQGRNGKDTMLKALGKVLGPHAGAMGNDVLISTGRGRDAGAASSHLMDLQGKRLIWASEAEDGQRFSVGQAKLLTGGGQINARAVYGKKNVTFAPSHLMILLTNHKPKAPADDAAFWARMQLVPFVYRFLSPDQYTGAPNERPEDTKLDDKLATELPGILAWLVRGCLEYQRVGIMPPAAVQLATAEYREDEDTLGDFLGDCCIIGEGITAPAGAMFAAYQAWAIENGYKNPMNNKLFGKRLKERFESGRARAGMVYFGVGLISAKHDDPDPETSGTLHAVYGDNSPYTPDLGHSNGINQNGVYGVYSKPVNSSHDSDQLSTNESLRIYPTHPTQQDQNSPLESPKTPCVGSNGTLHSEIDPTPPYTAPPAPRLAPHRRVNLSAPGVLKAADDHTPLIEATLAAQGQPADIDDNR